MYTLAPQPVAAATSSVASPPIQSTRSAAPGKAGAKQGKGKVERLCKRLECTDAQKTKIASISSKLAESSKVDRKAMKNLKTKLADEIAKDTPSKAAVSQIFADMDRRQDAIQERSKTALLETHALLTSAQRVELAELVERRGAKGIFGGKKGKKGKKGKQGKQGKKGKQSKQGKQGKQGKKAQAKSGKSGKGLQAKRRGAGSQRG